MYKFGVFLEELAKPIAGIYLFTLAVGFVMVSMGWAKGYGDDFGPFALGGGVLVGGLFWISDALKKAGVAEPPKDDESPP